MVKSSVNFVLFAVLLSGAAPQAFSQDQTGAVQLLREELEKIRSDYEERIERLEERIRTLEGASEEDSEGSSTLDELRRMAGDFAEKKEQEKAEQKKPGESHGPFSLNQYNPRLTVFGDFVGRLDTEKAYSPEAGSVSDPVEISDRFSFRELELDLRADVDPYARAVALVSLGEDVPGDYAVAVEEAFVDLHTIPGLEDIPHNLRFKFGRFRSDFGLVNRLHTHDLPWTDRPLPLEVFLGPEGDVENGLGVEYLVHNPWGEAITLGLQVVNAENDALFAGARADEPAYLTRLAWHKQLDPEHELGLGSSFYFGNARPEPKGGWQSVSLWGWDGYYRWRPTSQRNQTSLVFQTEWFLRHGKADPSAGEGLDSPSDLALAIEEVRSVEDSWGFYNMAQLQFLKNFYLGARSDYLAGVKEGADDFRHREAGYLSYYPSEFLRFRLGYVHDEAVGRFHDDTFSFQITWVFGSHPAEPYWVNR